MNSLYNLFSLLWNSNEKSISPTDFKYNLLTYLPCYSNSIYQHDASEFLFNLFEILNDELCLVKKNKALKGNENEMELLTKMQGESDYQASKRFWDFHRAKNDSILLDLFHGQYKSTINCLVCNNSSVYFEPFSTLTLDIPDLKRLDFIVVPNVNSKPIIKLTCFIPSNALFVDLPKFTTEKYRKENNSFFSNDKTKLKCLLVNCTTYSSRFVKLNDNIFQSSKKGNLIIFEVAEDDDENDYYPYICMIKEESEIKPEENKDKENEEELKDENKIKKENLNDNKENKENKKRPENLVYAYNRKEVSIVEDNKKKKKQEPQPDESSKNLSFPRLFNTPLGKDVRYLRIRLYGFMSKFYPFQFDKINHIPNISEFKSSKNFNDIYENIDIIKNTSEENFTEFLEEEYKFIFEENYESLSNTDYFNNFPYVVKLVSAKDDLKYKILFSKNPEEFNSQFESEMTLQKLNQYIKQGYKIVIEVSKKSANFDLVKTKLNEVISISPIDAEEGNGKNISLHDCLDNFILSEKLEKGNEWYCTSCKRNQNSMKRMELFYLPKNLIITLKRFESKLIGRTKIQIWKNNDLVKYPVNNLKLDKCFFSNTYYKENNISYDLYAVCQHSGSLEGGHYATACRNFGKWNELDDHTVFESDEETVVSKEAYVLFYRKKEKNNK